MIGKKYNHIEHNIRPNISLVSSEKKYIMTSLSDPLYMRIKLDKR